VTRKPLLNSFFLGGFECSSHRRRDGTRLDLLASTRHDELAEADYRQLRQQKIHTVRDGLRWHLIETRPGHYDWSSFLPMLRASVDVGTQVIWDLCHYGWPDDIDIWSADFPRRFSQFAGAAAAVVRRETDAAPYYCPINEISYWAWAGGDAGRINPCSLGRAAELKRQLVRAAVLAMNAIRAVDPRARFMTAEPSIHVTCGSGEPDEIAAAENYRLSQFETTDMLSGRRDPGLGGGPQYLDIVGVNFYPDNQWYFGGQTIPFGHHAYRPFADMLQEVHQRYGRPIVVSETGAEGAAKSSWLHYVGAEVEEARRRGASVEGICLYPVLDYPGWENGRLCKVGLLGPADPSGTRALCRRTADEIARQMARSHDAAMQLHHGER
jgi:hypothetical protein